MADNAEEPLRDRTTIHISLPEEATASEANAFWDDIADFLAEWLEAHPDRGQWDPFMWSHTESCDDSDHCHGPGSWVEKRIARQAKAEALKGLARHCFDENDAGVIVGGIEVVEMYVYDTIAELTGDPADQTNAERMREIAGQSIARKTGR